jgi:hypothetical protein
VDTIPYLFSAVLPSEENRKGGNKQMVSFIYSNRKWSRACKSSKGRFKPNDKAVALLNSIAAPKSMESRGQGSVNL